MTSNSTNPTRALRIVNRYGIPLGLTLIALTLVFFLIGIDKEKWTSLIFMLVNVIAIIICIRDVRSTLDHQINFGTAFKVAFTMSLFAVIISSIYFFIHINYVDSHYIEAMTDIQKKEMIEKGLNEDNINKAMQMTAKFNTPIFMTLVGGLVNLIYSAIASAIVAAIMKTK